MQNMGCREVRVQRTMHVDQFGLPASEFGRVRGTDLFAWLFHAGVDVLPPTTTAGARVLC